MRTGSHATAPRHVAEGDDPEVAVLRAQGLVVAYLTRAVFPHQGARLPLRSERETTLAESLDLIVAGRAVAAADLLMQRFRAVEAAALEDGGWSIVPDARVSSSTPSLRATAAAAERELQ